jgi:2',3'-cyclic-nucleotide 2'-phosphodiesterase (5'-nucleotidase family)
LAAQVEGIDLIVGGHTHTVPAIYPTVVDEDGTPTLVVQAGSNAEQLGHIKY